MTAIVALLRRHRWAVLAVCLGVVFALLSVGAVALGLAHAPRPDAAGPSTAQPAPAATATPKPEPTRAVPDATAAPSRVRTCSIAALARDPRLGSFFGQVVQPETGEVLFDRSGSTPARTGSVLKILTGAAAIAELGADHRIATRVAEGAEPGTLVLVGGGDPTLSRTPLGTESFYRGAPKLADLAAQTLDAWAQRHPDQQVQRIVLDATLWNPVDRWDPSWERSEQQIGYHSEVTALQVDADRDDPWVDVSPRSTVPVQRAGEFFLQALRAADARGALAPQVALETGAAPAGAAPLAEVLSQPVGVLVEQLMLTSDNTLAEMLARLVSLHRGDDGSAASLQRQVPAALADYGVDTSGVVIRDGSGLSEHNQVPPAYVTALLNVLRGGEDGLSHVMTGMPVAGQAGSLSSRFTGPNAVARGSVIAKPGWITTAFTLAGVVHAADGTELTFAFYAVGDTVTREARGALDTLTTGVYLCGDDLSNH